MFNDMPIGIFDSGVGGLTVMKEIIKALPDENIIYLGDTARVPYGGRSSETVRRYSVENAGILVSKEIKLLVVACNTSSAVSLSLLREQFSLPVIGVVEPGARAAVETTRLKKVAVIGTETTINSGSYETAIKAIDDSIEVFGVACPLFVPLIEEGWIHGEVVNLTARKYIASMNNNVDTVVLGCTHYPMMKNVISGIVNMPLIDSAIETAKEVRTVLEEKDMLCSGKGQKMRKFLVTDSTEKFARVGERFLGYEISDITKIELGG
jgi:glutamate racemase